MNVLAIDFGLQRIGLAFASTESGVAFTRPALQNCCGVIDTLVKQMEEEQIHHILLGLPLKRDNAPGDIDDALQSFSHQLSDRTNLTVEWINERYSSKMADIKIQELQLKKTVREDLRKSGEKDSMSAQILLQEWLEENT